MPMPGDLKTRYGDIVAYVTKDGSEIRELMHPDHQPVMHQSLAEAVVRPGRATQLHRHRLTEEIYHVTAGIGVMTLGDRRFPIAAGDTVLIPPGTAHCVEAGGGEPLRILCCCAPAYRHDDTELLAAGEG